MLLNLQSLFLRKKEYISSNSLSAQAWKRFRKDKLGFGSLIFIGLVFLIALLGYLITPDPTPFANDQCLEMGLKKPGYKAEFVLVPKTPPVERSNIFHRMIWGQKSRFHAYPVVIGFVDIYDQEGAYLRENQKNSCQKILKQN